MPRLETNTSPSTIIEIAGDVSSPGVYFFDYSPTMGEALTASGETIDGHQVNLPNADVKVGSGALLRVIKTPEGSAVDLLQMEAEKRILFEIPLDLNTAKGEDLSNIPGVGSRISGEIVAYRNKHGYFSKIEDLRKVKGIGKKKFKRIQKHFFVAADLPQ